MAPPSKKPRLSHRLDQDCDELDLNIEDLALDRQIQRSTYRSSFFFKSTLENIFEKYGRDFGNESDEVDLNTGKIIVDNGHFRGIFGGNLPVAFGDDGAETTGQVPEEGDYEEGIDLNQLDSDDEECSIDLGADGSDQEKVCHVLPFDALSDPPGVPETPKLPPSFHALQVSVDGGPSTSGTLLGTLNRLLTMAAQRHSASDAPFDPLSVTNELVEPAWRVPALPPSLLQRKPTNSHRNERGAPLNPIVRKRRPRSVPEADSEDEITTRSSNGRPGPVSLKEWNILSCDLQPRSTISPETSSLAKRKAGQDPATRTTLQVDKLRHPEPCSSVTTLGLPSPVEDDLELANIRQTQVEEPPRLLPKRQNETIVINIIDEKLRKLEQEMRLLDPSVEANRPPRQEACDRDESAAEPDCQVLGGLESSNSPQDKINEGLVETSTVEDTTGLGQGLFLRPRKRPGKQVEKHSGLFTRNHIDPSYGFSDEEEGGWVSAHKAAVKSHRRRPPIFRLRRLSPELGSHLHHPCPTSTNMPEQAASSDQVGFSNEPGRVDQDGEAEPQTEQQITVEAEYTTMPSAAHEDKELSMLADDNLSEDATVPESPSSCSAAVHLRKASHPMQSSRQQLPVDEPALEEASLPAKEHVSESFLELEVKQIASLESSLAQSKTTLQKPTNPQNQDSGELSHQSLPISIENNSSPARQGSAYLPRRTRRQWFPKDIVAEDVMLLQGPRPATPSPPAAPTISRRSARSVTSLLSLINGGSDEDELSICFTPRSHSVASSGGGYAGLGRHLRDTLSSPIKKRTPRSLSRRLFMTKASSGVRGKPKASSFSLLSGSQLDATPLTHHQRASGCGVRSRLNSSPVKSVINTPGGSKRKCGEHGFRCDRDWCFFCIGDQ